MLREFGCPQVQGFLYGYPGATETGTKAETNVMSITAARSSAA
jgi:EAL domain-containing protein (putative c-di-GMP-specific phosphodiesterase class I)